MHFNASCHTCDTHTHTCDSIGAYTQIPHSHMHCVNTGWRKCIGYLKLQVSICKRATNYRALCGNKPVKIRHPMSTPPCTHVLCVSLTHSLCVSLTHSLYGSLTHSLCVSLTHSLYVSLTHALCGSLTHSLCVTHALIV